MLRKIFLLLAVLTLWLPSFARAAVCTATSFTCSVYGGMSGKGISQAAACGSAVAKFNAVTPPQYFSLTLGSRLDAASFETPMTVRDGGEFVVNQVASVNISACSAPPPPSNCAANTGKKTTINFTEGYTRTTGELDRGNVASESVGPINRPPADGNFCSAGCTVSAETSGPNVTAYVSQTPNSQGLYRRSLDMPALGLGTDCTASGGSGTTDKTIDKAAPEPTCPGFVGEVNGKAVCAGTAAKPVVTESMGSNPSSASPVPGNPSAGEKPGSGEGSGSGGSGRTPSTGTGGNAGGPASSAVGSGGSGTVPAPEAGKEQAACGAPGQPKCLIDEAGTSDPWEADELKAHAEKYKSDVDAVRGTVSGSADKGFFSGWQAAFIVPPVAACEAFALPRGMGSIDPCPVAEGMRSVMAYIWAVGGLFLVLRMIKKVV